MRSERFLRAKKHNINGFSYHCIPNKTYSKAKMYRFGNQGSIFGCIDDDYNSCDAIQDSIEQFKPQALVLGDVSYSDMDYFKLGQLKFLRPPNLAVVQPEMTLARKKLNKFFQQDIELS